MIIGHLKLPNKWATTAMVSNQPFIYRSCPPYSYNPDDSWGGIIHIDPWMNNYKVICQDGYSVTEFWCINLVDGTHDHLLVPVLMKKYKSNGFTHRSFLLKNGIFDLLMETNREIPNFNRAYLRQYGAAELLMECLSEKPGLFEHYEKEIEALRVCGGFTTRFPSGTPFIIDELLRRCTPVEIYAKSTISLLNESADLRELGIVDRESLRRFFIEATPTNQITGLLDVDWIGEQLLLQNLTNFSFNDINGVTAVTPNSHNLMCILSDTVSREELIDVPNLTTDLIDIDYAKTHGDPGLGRVDSTYVDIKERIDTLINFLLIDDATTYVMEYNITTNQSVCIERIYGYGFCSIDSYTGMVKPKSDTELDFVLRDLCEILNAISIRIIKTFNEELFITITYNSKEVKSFYYNLIVHACVSGCLFSA